MTSSNSENFDGSRESPKTRHSTQGGPRSWQIDYHNTDVDDHIGKVAATGSDAAKAVFRLDSSTRYDAGNEFRRTQCRADATTRPMETITPTPVAPEGRLESIDILRGIALFGVLVVNLIGEFRVSIFQQFLPANRPMSMPDHIVEMFVSMALELKAFALFSFLFGVGLAVQFERLSRRGRAYYWLSRRLVVLLVFGLLHLLFIWNGDILIEYAIAAMLVLPFLIASTWAIAVGFTCFLGLYVVMPMMSLPIPWPDTETLQRHVADANIAYGAGSALDVWRFSIQELHLLLPLHLWILPRTIALFLLGMFAWRTGVMQRQERHLRFFWITGGVGVIVGAAITIASTVGILPDWGAFGAALPNLATVVLSMGYGAVVLALAQHPVAGKTLKVFAPLGRMAFSNYIMQSVIFGFIFFGYGLGYFGRLGALHALLIGMTVYTAQVLFSDWWLARFRSGPLEWLWRTLMFGVRQPMRKPAIHEYSSQ